MSGPWRRQATTKCRRPPGCRTTAMAGRTAAADTITWSMGRMRLFGDEPDVVGEILERIDRRAIDVGLAGFTQPSVAGGQAESVEEALERGGTTVHGGGLHDLGSQRSRRMAPGCGHVSSDRGSRTGPDGTRIDADRTSHGTRISRIATSHGTRITRITLTLDLRIARIARAGVLAIGRVSRPPRDLKTSHAGRTRSTSISTLPGSAWLSGRLAGRAADAELDAHEAVTQFVGDGRHARLEASVLGPREAEQPHARRLSHAHPADRRRGRELCDDAQRALGHDGREPVGLRRRRRRRGGRRPRRCVRRSARGARGVRPRTRIASPPRPRSPALPRAG